MQSEKIMIKIGIIGCGTVMNRYSDVFINEGIDGAKVVSVCDKDSSLAKKEVKN